MSTEANMTGELTFTEYQVLASRTLPRILDSDPIDLAHMALGLVSETSELKDAIVKYMTEPAFDQNTYINITEEFCDMMWYLAGWCTIRGYELVNVTRGVSPTQAEEEDFGDLQWCIAELGDLAKKYLAYGKAIDKAREGKLLACTFHNIAQGYNEFGHDAGLTLIPFGRGLMNNIAKLTVRYPQKFDKDLAQNRDLAAEFEKLKQ